NDISDWNAKLDSPVSYNNILGRPDLSDTSNYLKKESDPVFAASLASKISEQDTTRWGTQPSFSSPWIEDETTVTYNGKAVIGEGVSSVKGRIHVVNPDSTEHGIHVQHNSKSSHSFGVYAELKDPVGTNVEFTALHGFVSKLPVIGSGKGIGVNGRAFNIGGPGVGRSYGVLGEAGDAPHGYNYGVYGVLYDIYDGAAVMGGVGSDMHRVLNGQWAGYFAGKVHVQDTLGVGTTQPQRVLHVNDAMRLQPTSAPVDATLGDMFMDAADSTLKVYDGSQWRELW
ncbi:MAG: hypothetical protein MI892_18210, partial [Desulfobacterales bacterium]|nr:hypothetical protein [Desulfobacterales bacterium]